MGFFPVDDIPAGPAPIKVAPRKQTRAEIKGARGCDDCALRVVWPRITSPCMARSHGAGRPDIMVLGDSPRHEDDASGKHFENADGRLLRKTLPGRAHERVAFSYLVKCYPGEGKNPTLGEIHSCSLHLEREIEEGGFRAILGIGPIVLSYFFPGLQILDVYGTWIPLKIGARTVWFYPVLDPTFLRTRDKYGKGPTESGAYPVFNSDIQTFFRDLDRKPDPEVAAGISPDNVFEPADEAAARDMLAEMDSGAIAIDLETSKLRPYDRGARLLTGSFSDGCISASFAIDHPERGTEWGLRLLVEIMNTRPWAAHNAAFEYMWIYMMAEAAGIPFDPQPFEDSMALARVYHARNCILSLDDVSFVNLGVNVKKITNVRASQIMQYPLAEVIPYCGIDTLACRRIIDKLRRKIDERNYQRLLGTVRVTSDMAIRGLDIDLDASLELKGIWQERARVAQETACGLYEAKAFSRAQGREWSIGSAQDVGTALVDYGKLDLPKTSKGAQYATDDATLKKAAGEDHPLVNAVIEYREATKMVSTYIEPILTAPERCIDSRLHPSYTVMLTQTTRLSAEDPSIQNFPKHRHIELRRQVRARKGHLLVRFDYKAIEGRTIGMASKDRLLCESFIKGTDLHARWRDVALSIYPDYINRLAERTNETDMKKILKGGRDIIKSDFVFASLYGATVNACAQRTGMPLTYMQDLASEFWREHSGVKNWIKGQRTLYKATGSIWLLTGLERHDIMWGNEPLNNPAQGSAASLVADSMIDLADLARRERDPYFHPRIQIHDDITFEFPEDCAEQYIEVVMPILTKLRYDWQIVPLAVEGAVGTTWENLEEFCSYTGEYAR